VARAPGLTRSALLIAALAVLAGTPAAVAADRLGAARDGAAGQVAKINLSAAPAVDTRSAGDARAAAGARARIDAALVAQAAALARGDAAGYLAQVDPPLQTQMRQRYEALRALRVVGYAAATTGEISVAGSDRWRATVEISFCAAAAGCAAAPVLTATTWVVTGDSARLVGSVPSTTYGPRPWEVSELRAVVGARVVVAAPPRYAGRLAPTLEAAERAAARSDRYARWRPAPSRYVVYLAGPEEWSTWYGVKQPAWAAGFAMPITTEHTEIVLNASRIDSGEIRNTLTHEFTHVTSLAGVQRSYTDSWLLVEGLAEYVAHAERAVSAYPWLSGTRRYVRSGLWPGTADLAAPPESATVSDATGRYGVAYVAVRRLAERFGEARLLDFFAAVARDGRRPADAAPQILGVPWADAAADCDRAVRAA
jgi:hypothetical protein